MLVTHTHTSPTYSMGEAMDDTHSIALVSMLVHTLPYSKSDAGSNHRNYLESHWGFMLLLFHFFWCSLTHSLSLSLCVCTCVCARMPWNTCEGQMITCGSWLSPSFKSSGLNPGRYGDKARLTNVLCWQPLPFRSPVSTCTNTGTSCSQAGLQAAVCLSITLNS